MWTRTWAATMNSRSLPDPNEPIEVGLTRRQVELLLDPPSGPFRSPSDWENYAAAKEALRIALWIYDQPQATTHE